MGRFFKLHDRSYSAVGNAPCTSRYDDTMWCGACNALLTTSGILPALCPHCHQPPATAGYIWRGQRSRHAQSCVGCGGVYMILLDNRCTSCHQHRSESTYTHYCANCGNSVDVNNPQHTHAFATVHGTLVCNACPTGTSISGVVSYRQLMPAVAVATSTCACGRSATLPVVGTNTGLCGGCAMNAMANPTTFLPMRGDEHPLFPADQVQGFEVECVVRAWDNAIYREARVKSDGSLRVGQEGGMCVEFAVLPASGTALANRVTAMGQILANMQAYANRSCGLHIHQEVRGWTPDQRTTIRGWWRLFEPLFSELVPDWRRTNSFCRTIGAQHESTWEGQRYSALNLQALSSHGTYEVRLPDGSIDPEYITFWLSLLGNFFSKMRNHPLDDSILEFVSTATDREILAKYIALAGWPTIVVKQIVDRLRGLGNEGWLSKAAPAAPLASQPPPPVPPPPPVSLWHDVPTGIPTLAGATARVADAISIYQDDYPRVSVDTPGEAQDV